MGFGFVAEHIEYLQIVSMYKLLALSHALQVAAACTKSTLSSPIVVR
jgi:hypothetical protein